MILVTGASGFLGSAVVRLARARGLRVRAMVRGESSLNLLGGLPEEFLARADLEDPGSLDLAVQGAEAVIHCAAATPERAPDLETSRRINVEGTRALLEACARGGVKRFIQISSQSAHPDNPSVYGRTKLAADGVLKELAGIGWTILKPSIIYGAQAKGIFDKMAEHCRRLPVVPVIGPKSEMRPVHVDDVAWAALACLEKPGSIGQTYDIGGADVLAFQDFIQAIIHALGKRKPTVPLPIPVALALAHSLSLVMKNPPLTPDNVRGIQTAPHVDISAAQKDLGFRPRFFAQGLRDIWPAGGGARVVSEERTVPVSAGEGPLRVALIGLGKMGVVHASSCGVLDDLEIVALVDRDAKLGSQFQSMGVKAPFYDSVEALFGSGVALDAALIITPSFTHRGVGTACLERGLHVFCEKPLAHTLEDARAMAAAAREHPDLVTATGFVKGHYSLWLEAARRLQSGWIGTPRRFAASVYLSQVFSPMKGWQFTKEKAGGGILINSGIHLVHFLRVLFGDMASVTARARSMHSEVEDTLAAVMEFRSGVFGSYDTSWSVPGYQTEGTRVLVEGDAGTME
ncbi:Gfo/Idh/MocA family oxidoreductase, partial [bacterium]|nr:Gfo/Idh/MocA family oxidoreductase [bacterium]